MGSQDDLDDLLALGSERPQHVEACIDESAIDEADLLAYRQGALSDAAREQVELHLIDCPYCRDLVAHIEIPRRVRRWPMVVGGAVAAMAAVVLILASPPPREPMGAYRIAAVHGQIAARRADADPEGRRFRPESQVEIKVEPDGGRAAKVVHAFRLDDSVLADVPAAVEAGEAGVFTIKGSGRQIFGDTFGPKRIIIVASDRELDVSRIVGRTLIAAQSVTTETSWLPAVDADYVNE